MGDGQGGIFFELTISMIKLFLISLGDKKVRSAHQYGTTKLKKNVKTNPFYSIKWSTKHHHGYHHEIKSNRRSGEYSHLTSQSYNNRSNNSPPWKMVSDLQDQLNKFTNSDTGDSLKISDINPRMGKQWKQCYHITIVVVTILSRIYYTQNKTAS